ncbi:hypothetical protein GCM10025864_33820 [Luteimicrobium album]|uniref:Uncharacterized protein n=1 Tax=Luteimicrobium album TaxID=1054550 RepID=A0ABQ6I666_9MICO|nr:hypothetical protein [Luteimicrobium album]GMA25623.1 hypothetical protein GCM10025864_33820 [Luteimicrobium album]
MEWDDMAALEAALDSEIGRRIADDATTNLGSLATFRGLALQLDDA